MRGHRWSQIVQRVSDGARIWREAFSARSTESAAMPGVEPRMPPFIYQGLPDELKVLPENNKSTARADSTQDGGPVVWHKQRVPLGTKPPPNLLSVDGGLRERPVLAPSQQFSLCGESGHAGTGKFPGRAWRHEMTLNDLEVLLGVNVHAVSDGADRSARPADRCFKLGGGAEAMQLFAKAQIAEHRLQSNFYTVDLGRLVLLHEAFVKALPRVQPFYAVKCNPGLPILRTLAALGCGFDCASAKEMQDVSDLGVRADRIIFAHPCKAYEDLSCAVDLGVQTMVFDCEDELDKISEECPGAQLVLRIKVDDTDAIVQFGHKYGADPKQDGPALLESARRRGLQVVGVSFHIGSASQSPAAYHTAIAAARGVFDAARAQGTHLRLLDLGGGFYGRFDRYGAVGLRAAAAAINDALTLYFPNDDFSDLKVIAEPGRYFAESIATFYTMVHTVKYQWGPDGSVQSAKYYISDGVYGSFNGLVYDHGFVGAKVLRSPSLPPPTGEQQEHLVPSTVFGPTCDGVDLILKDVPMPLLRRRDWLHVPNYGAYSIAGACAFNGLPVDSPHVAYVWSGASPVGPWEQEQEHAWRRGDGASCVRPTVPEHQHTFFATLKDLDSI